MHGAFAHRNDELTLAARDGKLGADRLDGIGVCLDPKRSQGIFGDLEICLAARESDRALCIAEIHRKQCIRPKLHLAAVGERHRLPFADLRPESSAPAKVCAQQGTAAPQGQSQRSRRQLSGEQERLPLPVFTVSEQLDDIRRSVVGECERQMRAAQVAVDPGDGEIFGNVNLRLLQPAQEAPPVVERNAGILHAREPLSSFLADQLALPVLATIRVA